ncbi:MAG: hypothetical protein ACTSRQ_05600 [Candidatus Thorarchaeota archaeon]
MFKYKPGHISRGEQAIFLIFVAFYALSPAFYLTDRWELFVIQFVMAFVFIVTLRHWGCSQCPNFGCILNTVPEEKRMKFLEALKKREIY